MRWFTSDPHLGHENILRYAHRDFPDIKTHDAALIDAWNAVVASGDTVYHFGDFTLSGGKVATRYFKQLRGEIHILSNPWHHDKHWLSASVPSHVHIEPPVILLEFDEYSNVSFPKALTLCHFPFASWPRKHYNAWHAHGHQHRLTDDREELILDVGVDHANTLFGTYRPFSLDEIAEIFTDRKTHHLVP